MADAENKTVEQLWYTWSGVGLSTVHAGFRIRAASQGLTDIYSERVKSLDRYTRYMLPPRTDRSALTPDQAPVCLAFLRTDWHNEPIVVHKEYVGLDGVGRQGNFFTHLYALDQAGDDFLADEAIWLWNSSIWKKSDAGKGRSTALDTVSLKDLKEDGSFRPNYNRVDEIYLRFIIEAYLTRNGQAPLYIGAPANASEQIATMIAGLTRCLPRQLLSGLTFSTYEPDISKATTQIVGTCWIAGQSKETHPEQVFSPQFYTEQLALNCDTHEHSPLKNHPLTTNKPLATRFAKAAAQWLIYDDTNQLDTLLEAAEESPDLSVDMFLRLYNDMIAKAERLTAEDTESYLRSPHYRISRLYDRTFRESIVDRVAQDQPPQWWQTRLKPLLTGLLKESQKESSARAPEQGQSRNAASTQQISQGGKSSARTPRKKKGKGQDAVALVPQGQTLVYGLFLLAKTTTPTILTHMRHMTSPQTTSPDAISAIDRRATVELLELMDSTVTPRDPYGAWRELVEGITHNDYALTAVRGNWDIHSFLLARSNSAFPASPEYDILISPLLILPWSRLGDFLKLRLHTEHLTWHVIAAEGLLRDTSLTPPFAASLEQRCGVEIHKLLELLSSERAWWPVATSFAIALIENSYRGRQRYPALLEALLDKLITAGEIPQAKALALALTRNGYVTREPYLSLVGGLLQQLLSHSQLQQDGLDLIDSLVANGYPSKGTLLQTLINSSAEGNLDDILRRVYRNDAELAEFFVNEGRNYLHSPKQVAAMMNIYARLAGYPARKNRLFVLLDVLTREDYVLEVLRITTPSMLDELVGVVKRYGKTYLENYRQTPELAQYVKNLYELLIMQHPASRVLLFDLFTPQTSGQYLEALLTSAHLTEEESRAFLQKFGTDPHYFPFFYGSENIRSLLAKYAQFINAAAERAKPLSQEQARLLSQEKMELLFAWLSPAYFKRGELQPDSALGILQSASLTPDEQAEFLEQYGINYLPLPLPPRYIKNFVDAFTLDTLEQPKPKEFLLLLERNSRTLTLDDGTKQQIQGWATIASFLDAPDLTKLKPFAIALFYFNPPSKELPSKSTLIRKLAHSFVSCAPTTDDLVHIKNAMSDVLKNDWVQLFYRMAEQVTNFTYQSASLETILLRYILFALENPPPDRPDHFVLVFLDALLANARPVPWRELDMYVVPRCRTDAQQRWYRYLEGLGLINMLKPQEGIGQASMAPQDAPPPGNVSGVAARQSGQQGQRAMQSEHGQSRSTSGADPVANKGVTLSRWLPWKHANRAIQLGSPLEQPEQPSDSGMQQEPYRVDVGKNPHKADKKPKQQR